MSLDDIVKVNVTGSHSDGHGEYYPCDFSTYGTVAFTHEMMERGIRPGRLRVDEDGQPLVDAAFQPIFDPAPMLDVTLWLMMVPEVYRKAAVDAVNAVGPKYLREQITPRLIHAFVCDLQQWISTLLSRRASPTAPGRR